MTEQHARVLEAAMEVFAERGYRRTSIDAVAERADLTRQGVLHYFPSKKRLLLAVLHYREELDRRYVAVLPEHDVDVAAALADAVVFEQSHPHMAQVFAVVMAEAATGLEPARTWIRERRAEHEAHLAAHLTERYGERVPSGLTPRTAAAALLALVEGIHLQWLVEADKEQDRYPVMMRDAAHVLLGTRAQEPEAGSASARVPAEPSPSAS